MPLPRVDSPTVLIEFKGPSVDYNSARRDNGSAGAQVCPLLEVSPRHFDGREDGNVLFHRSNIRNPFTRCLLSVTLSMGLVQCETIFYTQYDHL